LAKNKKLEIINPERLDPEFGVMALTPLSWSRIETYGEEWSTFACAKKYKFKYMDHEAGGWSVPLAIGSSVHDTLEWAIKNDAVDEREIVGRYVSAVRAHDPNNRMTDSEMSDGRAIAVQTFRQMHDVVGDHIRDIIDVEWGFRYIIGRALFTGFIDLMFWDEDEEGRFIHIIDYKTSAMDKKTGKPKKSTKTHGQTAIYTMATKRRFPGERVKASLYWLRAPIDEDFRLDTYEYSDKELRKIEKRISQTTANLIEDENFQVTKKMFVCAYCDFATADLCKYGQGAAARFNKYRSRNK
jgi:CRISPR/Cas system-associated exonuclease Cas4 (RecB family)